MIYTQDEKEVMVNALKNYKNLLPDNAMRGTKTKRKGCLEQIRIASNLLKLLT